MNYTNSIINQVLEKNASYLGKQYDTYRNHVYRVFLLCQQLDDDEVNIEKYAIASVFHDLGIWTHKSFDYLDPYIQLARDYLGRVGQEEWADEISIMIDMHHKRSRYIGEYETTVETFRRADWIDVTKGRKSYKVERKEIAKINDTYPNLGFHRFLVVETIKNLFKSPLNPLPMFKK